MEGKRWLDDEDNRKTLFWAVIAALCTPFVLALVVMLWLAFVLLGAALGLWPPPFSR